MNKLAKNIEEACSQIAPLWPLSNFVAVNPYLGFSNKAFSRTALYLKQVQGAEMLMPLAWYKQKFKEGEIGMSDLQAALERAPLSMREAYEENGFPLSEVAHLEGLKAIEDVVEPLHCPETFCTYIDARLGTHWQHFIREESAKWCAAYYDRGQSTWQFPWKEKNFYAAWQKAVQHDHNLECAGLPGARASFSKLPESPEEAIEQALSELDIPEPLTKEWLYQVLLVIPGWAGHMRYLDREQELRNEQGTALKELLAIMLSYERVLHGHFTQNEDCLLGWKRNLMKESLAGSIDSLPLLLAQRLLWQSAFEHQIEERLRTSIQRNQSQSIEPDSPEIQAAFCIDVRSEVFRRNLEAASPNIQTLGFAGFFGMPLKHLPANQKTEQARCPALLAPPLASHENCHHPYHDGLDPHGSERAWKRFREAAASCFSFVETLGLGYAWKLARSAFGGDRTEAGSKAPSVLSETLSLETKVQLATGILKGLTLSRQCGKLILLCGHGSATQNNPYASGLDCGACGGHLGDANARIAAALLNDSSVRAALSDHGICLPEETFFIAGLHNTTTDEVTIFDQESLPSTHQELLQALKQALVQAGISTATVRAKSLDVANGNPIAQLHQRSRDWSQVRPEWGLAGNAGFIIAPRNWTKTVSLDGRAFLNEYDPAADPEGSLLESIMAGPFVVGSWINLQYYASATDNPHYGSGHKAIHNVVGGLGVALGNESDLKPGLPLQSVHNGQHLMHEPTRLHACVAADPEIIDIILERHPEITELVENEWMHLFALGADGSQWRRRLPKGQWSKRQQDKHPKPPLPA